MSAGLLDTAKKLVCEDPDGTQPTEYDSRRSISTSYYALFHFIAESATHQFAAGCSDEIQNKMQRAFDHQQILKHCRKLSQKADTDPGILEFANTFQTHIENRHLADYDPGEYFNKSQAQLAIAQAESAIDQFNQSSEEEQADFIAGMITKNR